MTAIASSVPARAAPPTTAPSFSIVIPTYNERDDIAATLRAATNQTLAADIIVVDGGSDDDTASRVRAFPSDAIALIEEGSRKGVAAARNAGMRSAAGDIVVFLNADVTLPPDFLARLAAIYDDGADAVSVESRVENLDAVTARYVQAMHETKYAARSVGWSEGFSCRRDLALAAAFPEEIPGAGGEDVEFLRRLRAAGADWRVDYSIVVTHRVPATVAGFFTQFRGRGRAVPYAERRLRGMSIRVVTARRALASLRTLATALAIVPNVAAAIRLARRSPRGMRDLPSFWLLHQLLPVAHRIGEWQSVRAIRQESLAAR